MRPPAVHEADLHALVDGELPPERRREIEDHLAAHAEDAALVERWRRQNAALRAAFEQVAREAPPPVWRAAARGENRPMPIETGATHWGRPSTPRSVRRLDDVRRARRRKSLLVSAAMLLAGVLVAGAAALFFHAHLTAPAPEAAIGEPAASGYVGRASLTYFTFAADARPVEIDAAHGEQLRDWLRARLGFGRAPDLSSLGLNILGGRLIPGVAGPAGLLLYEDPRGARVGLYFERAEAEATASAPPRVAPGQVAIEWRASGLAFVLIGPLGPEAMQAAAEKAAAETAGTEAGVAVRKGGADGRIAPSGEAH